MTPKANEDPQQLLSMVPVSSPAGTSSSSNSFHDVANNNNNNDHHHHHHHQQHESSNCELTTINFETLTVEIPPSSLLLKTTTSNNDDVDQIIKEWIWENYKEEILSGMTLLRSSSSSIDEGCEEQVQQAQQHQDHHQQQQEEEEKKDQDQDYDDGAATTVLEEEEEEEGLFEGGCSSQRYNNINCHNNNNNVNNDCATVNSTSCDSLLSDKQLELLERVAHAQCKYLKSEGPISVYNCLLEGLLEMMGSEFGFIGEARYDHNNTMYLHIHVSTDISWDGPTRRFYERHHKAGLDFYHLDNLFGRVLLDRSPIIANDAKNDKRSRGLPPGHPNVKNFLGVPIFAEGGELLGMFAVANKPTGYGRRDVKFLEPFTHTCANVIQAYFANQENKRLIQTLQSANEELELANKRVLATSELQLRHFACMSHEIRTPLNCIIGMLSLLLKSEDEDNPLSPMQQESMRLVVSSGELLATVVNDVLDYSKLESGNVDFHLESRSLQDTMDTVIRSITVKAASKDIKLKTIFDPRIPEIIQTDHLRLQQILFNLLGNAVKFSKDEGGTIDLRVSILGDFDEVQPTVEEGGGHIYYASDETESETSSSSSSSGGSLYSRASSSSSNENNNIQNHHHHHRLRFSVKDYGKGLELHEFENVFRPFFQTEEETKQVNGGTGLGLAITAKLVHGLGGTISVNSKLGEWSCFTVDFPMHDEPQDLSAMMARPEPLEGMLEVLLITPPDSMVAEELPSKLQAYGVRLATLSSMDRLEDVLLQQGDKAKRKKFACLVSEDLYKEDSYFAFSKKTKSVLLTYGPKFLVRDSREHIICPLQVLPSVLMERIKRHVVAAIDDAESESCSQPSTLKGSSGAKNCTIPVGKTNNMDGPIVPQPKRLQNCRILVAEDNKINQKVIVGMLKRLGVGHYEIANNGKEAVEKESATEFDLILMDMQMPVMDGIEACKAIVARKNDSHPKPPVVFVTAHAMISHEVECSKAGGSGFLTKPYKIDKIEELLLSYNERRAV